MQNFLKDWSLRRFIYLFGGLLFIFIAVKDRMWWFIPFAMYFIAMAVFKFGCASGNCETGIPTNNRK